MAASRTGTITPVEMPDTAGMEKAGVEQPWPAPENVGGAPRATLRAAEESVAWWLAEIHKNEPMLAREINGTYGHAG